MTVDHTFRKEIVYDVGKHGERSLQFKRTRGIQLQDLWLSFRT